MYLPLLSEAMMGYNLLITSVHPAPFEKQFFEFSKVPTSTWCQRTPMTLPTITTSRFNYSSLMGYTLCNWNNPCNIFFVSDGECPLVMGIYHV